MKKFRLAALVALVSTLLGGPVAAQQPAGGTLLNYPDTALGGFISAEIPKALDDCDKLCSERSGCVGFDHQASTNQCRLYGSIGSARPQAGSTARTRNQLSNYRDPTNLPRQQVQQTPPPPVRPVEPAPRNFTRFEHHDLGGSDLLQTSSNSVGRCEELCRENGQCVAYTYNAWSQRCFLKSGTERLRLDARARSGTLTGTAHPGLNTAPVVMEYYRDYIISGSPIGQAKTAGSRNQCENLCWDNNACIAFSFSQSRRQCVLFSEADNRFPRSGNDSGSKVQPRP